MQSPNLQEKIKTNEELRNVAKEEFLPNIIPTRIYSQMLIDGKFGQMNNIQKEKMKIIQSYLHKIQEKITDSIE